MKTLFALLLAVMLALASPAYAKKDRAVGLQAAAVCEVAPCEKYSPLARFDERTVLTESGVTVELVVTVRNANSCSCESETWWLSPGFHFQTMRVNNPRLRTMDGQFQPYYMTLSSGEEYQFKFLFDVASEQDLPAYVWPSIFFVRYKQTGDFCIDAFDLEGTAVCVGYTYAECRELSYTPAPADLRCPL